MQDSQPAEIMVRKRWHKYAPYENYRQCWLASRSDRDNMIGFETEWLHAKKYRTQGCRSVFRVPGIDIFEISYLVARKSSSSCDICNILSEVVRICQPDETQ